MIGNHAHNTHTIVAQACDADGIANHARRGTLHAVCNTKKKQTKKKITVKKKRDEKTCRKPCTPRRHRALSPLCGNDAHTHRTPPSRGGAPPARSPSPTEHSQAKKISGQIFFSLSASWYVSITFNTPRSPTLIQEWSGLSGALLFPMACTSRRNNGAIPRLAPRWEGLGWRAAASSTVRCKGSGVGGRGMVCACHAIESDSTTSTCGDGRGSEHRCPANASHFACLTIPCLLAGGTTGTRASPATTLLRSAQGDEGGGRSSVALGSKLCVVLVDVLLCYVWFVLRSLGSRLLCDILCGSTLPFEGLLALSIIIIIIVIIVSLLLFLLLS